jgi:hypothetical protein
MYYRFINCYIGFGNVLLRNWCRERKLIVYFLEFSGVLRGFRDDMGAMDEYIHEKGIVINLRRGRMIE